MAIPFDQLPIGEGLHPTGEPGASFFIDRTELELIERDGPEWKFFDTRFLEEAVREPDAIFEVSNLPDEGETHCYSVRLTRDPAERESEALPRYGFVFLVFARVGVGGYVVFDWEWREEDPDVPGHPLNWGRDFARRTWPKT